MLIVVIVFLALLAAQMTALVGTLKRMEFHNSRFLPPGQDLEPGQVVMVQLLGGEPELLQVYEIDEDGVPCLIPLHEPSC